MPVTCTALLKGRTNWYCLGTCNPLILAFKRAVLRGGWSSRTYKLTVCLVASLARSGIASHLAATGGSSTDLHPREEAGGCGSVHDLLVAVRCGAVFGLARLATKHKSVGVPPPLQPSLIPYCHRRVICGPAP